MTLYSQVQDAIEGMEIGDLNTIAVPDKLKAFRKFLSEISSKEHKKFTTKVYNNKLQIMRIKYYSITQTIETND